MRFERAQPRRSGRSALAVVGLLPILLFGTSPPIRGHPGAPAVGPALVATAQRCGALTASLTLLAVARETAALPAGAVRGLRWRLAIDAPPAPAGGDGGDASLEVFTIRGARAARAERPILRWTGEGDGFSEGPLAPPPLDGEVRAGDLVRVRATIRTPAAAIALGGLLFTLRATADGFVPADPVALPLTPCGPRRGTVTLMLDRTTSPRRSLITACKQVLLPTLSLSLPSNVRDLTVPRRVIFRWHRRS